MSYSTVNTAANDTALQARVSAAVAQEAWYASTPPPGSFTAMARQSPTSAMLQLIWPVCSASDVEAAYASALAANNPNPGGDESVVTDGMILASVQGAWPADAAVATSSAR